MKFRRFIIVIVVLSLLLSLALPIVAYADAPPSGISRMDNSDSQDSGEIPSEQGNQGAELNSAEIEINSDGNENNSQISEQGESEQNQSADPALVEPGHPIQESSQDKVESPDASGDEELPQSEGVPDVAENLPQSEPETVMEEKEETEEPETETSTEHTPWFNNVTTLTVIICILSVLITLLSFILWKIRKRY